MLLSLYNYTMTPFYIMPFSIYTKVYIYIWLDYFYFGEGSTHEQHQSTHIFVP